MTYWSRLYGEAFTYSLGENDCLKINYSFFPEIHSCLIHILDYCNNRGVDPTEPIELVLPKDYGAKTSYDTEITVIYDQEPVVPEVIDLEVESEKVDGEEEVERVVIEFQERPDFRSDRDFGRESESSFVLTQITILLLTTCLYL